MAIDEHLFCLLCHAIVPALDFRGSLKRSARAVQLFGCMAVLETHTLRY